LANLDLDHRFIIQNSDDKNLMTIDANGMVTITGVVFEKFESE